MNLLEYQAKELFRAVGIPVLPSQQIHQPRDMKDLQVAYPIVLKSQVYTGGRGRVGGVRFVQNTIDGIAAAQAIFNLPILGEYPKVLLAEAKYEAERELYLSVTINPTARRPVLLGSIYGGVDLQTSIDQTHQVLVEDEFSAFYGRRLALAMGLEGELINQVSGVIEKMYQLLVQKDLDLVEINPLAVRNGAEVMALDGKVTANDAALARHPDLKKWQIEPSPTFEIPLVLQETTHPAGSWGVISSGVGLTMSTVDQLIQVGTAVDSYIDLCNVPMATLTPDHLAERLTQALLQISQRESVIHVVVNLLPEMLLDTAIVPFLREVMHGLQRADVDDQVLSRLVAVQIYLCGAKQPLQNPIDTLAIMFFSSLDTLLAARPWTHESSSPMAD